MSCMEHECQKCGHIVFNNSKSGGKCPKCGGLNWDSTFDELPDYDPPEPEPGEAEDCDE